MTPRARRPAIVRRMRLGRVENSEQGELREFIDAVLALSDEPTRANVERYLAKSSALEDQRRSGPIPGEGTSLLKIYSS